MYAILAQRVKTMRENIEFIEADSSYKARDVEIESLKASIAVYEKHMTGILIDAGLSKVFTDYGAGRTNAVDLVNAIVAIHKEVNK